MVAADERPWIVTPFFMITPAPRKPMPVTTWLSTRRLSLFTGPPLAMAFMMTLGITLRRSGFVAEYFFTWFYTGLGTALSIAGIRFLIRCAGTGE